MKLKKSFVTPAVLCLAAAGLISCGGVKGDTSKDTVEFEPLTATNAKPSGKVVFWSNVYEKNKAEVAYAQKMVEDFNKIYPNIEVEFLGKGVYSDIDKEVRLSLSTPNTLPNLVIGYPDYFTSYRDRLVDLRPYMEDPYIGFGKTFNDENKVVDDPTTAKDDVYAQYFDEGKSYGGHGVYSLPYGKSSEAFFINDTIFAENNFNAPKNWKEALDIARTYRAAHEDLYTKGKLGVYAPISFHSTSNLFITFSEMVGAPYAGTEDLNKDGRLSKNEAVLFNNDKTKSLLKHFKKWFNEGLFTTKDITFKQGGQKYVENDFVYENPTTIMLYDSTKGTPYVANSIKKVQDEGKDWEHPGANNVSSAHSVLNIDPEMLGDKAYTPSNKLGKAMDQGGSIAMFDKDEESNKCAWLFYKFLTNTDNITHYSLMNKTAPLRKSCLNTEDYKAITAKKDVTLTVNSSYEDQNAKLTNEVFALYESYGTNNQLMRAPVNYFSGAQRKAVEDMFIQIMVSDATTDAQIDTVVNNAVKNAYKAI